MSRSAFRPASGSVIVQGIVHVAEPLAFVAVTVIVPVPTVVGVPVIRRVAGLNCNPDGRPRAL